MRALTIVALIHATAPQAAFANDEIIKQPGLPDWARISEPLPVPPETRGAIFIRRQNAQIHLHKQGQTAFTASLIRILQPAALQLGNVALSWNPAAGKPVIQAVKVHRDGEVRDVLESTEFEVLRREDQLEAAMLDGNLTAVLRIPDLRVGDDLELSYSLPEHDPTLGNDSFGLMLLAHSPPPGRYMLTLSWIDGQEPFMRPTADLQPSIKRETRAAYIATDMPDTLVVPKDAPPRYSWQRIIEFSDFSTWNAVSSRIAPLFDKAAVLAPGSAVKQEAVRIATANPDPFSRAAAALKLVQQQVRYVYVGFNGGNLTPASADETWKRRYGDCKAKTALLLAILNELGIRADALLASNAGLDDGLDQRQPSPGSFDHILVRAQIGGMVYWLDGTLPDVFPPASSPVMPYRWVLPLSHQGAAIEQVAWLPLARPDELMLYEIDARAGFAAPAAVRQTSIRRGPTAIAEYYQFSSVTDDQLQNAFKQRLEGSSNWDSVERVAWRFDAKEQASVLEIVGRGPVDWDDDGGGSRSLSLPGGGFSPPDRRQRGNEQDQSIPFFNTPGFDCRVTTVRLPEGTAAKDWSFNSTYNTAMYGKTYRRSFERRDGTIRMIRSNRTLRAEIDPASAAKDNVRLASFDNSMAWIYYEPGSKDEPGPAETVPSTFEIDWVASDAVCLAPKRQSK